MKMSCWCQRRMGRLVRDDRKVTVTQITTRYNQGMQNIPSLNTQHVEPWSRWATAAEDHTGCSCQLRSVHQNWTIEDWKNVAWSDESRFLLRHSDGRVRICRKEHEGMDPSSDATSSRIMHHVTKLKSSQTGFLNMTMVHFTQMASTVTRSQSNRAPLGFGGTGDSHHGSAAIAWCYHVNMDQNLWGMFPTPCWIYALKN